MPRGWQTRCSGNRISRWGAGGRRPPHGGSAKHTAKLALRPGKVALLGDVVESLERLGTVAVDVDGQHPHQARIHPPPPPLLLLCSISGTIHVSGRLSTQLHSSNPQAVLVEGPHEPRAATGTRSRETCAWSMAARQPDLVVALVVTLHSIKRSFSTLRLCPCLIQSHQRTKRRDARTLAAGASLPRQHHVSLRIQQGRRMGMMPACTEKICFGELLRGPASELLAG